MANVHAMDGGEKPVFAEINMIPFIDVSLVLLIIFMVLSPMLVKAGVDVELPGAATAKPLQDKTLDISMALDGQVFVEDKPADLAGVEAQVRKALAGNPNMVIVIRADGASRYKKVISLADAVRKAGGKKLAFGTKAQDVRSTPDPESVPTP